VPKINHLVLFIQYLKTNISSSNVSLKYSFNLAGALGALGRRFESCRPDSVIPMDYKYL